MVVIVVALVVIVLVAGGVLYAVVQHRDDPAPVDQPLTDQPLGEWSSWEADPEP